MAKEYFDISKYIPEESQTPQVEKKTETPMAKPVIISDNAYDEVRSAVEKIVSMGVDVTGDYPRWRDIGFALVDLLGENGRELYHQLSQMSAKYAFKVCDDQYTKCMNAKGCGITGATFWAIAKEAGIDLRQMAIDRMRASEFCAPCADAQVCANEGKIHNSLILNDGSPNAQHCADAQTAQMPPSDDCVEDITFRQTFSDKLPVEIWPEYFRTVFDSMDDAEGRDKMLLAVLNLNSGIIPNYFGLYGGHIVYPPLYTIFFGPAASRKGEIRSCLEIIKPLKNEIRAAYEAELANYHEEHAQWDAKGGKSAERGERGAEPVEPEYRSPLIPANSSASAAYMALKANGGWGAMFETEADVLSQSLLSDYGDYSAGLRAAAHHETISLNRVKDKLHIDIEEPKLAVCITCTPGQLPKLFPSFENGLGSRFLFYGLNRKVEWISPFRDSAKPLDEVYAKLGEMSLELRHQLEALGKRRIQFVMSDSQQVEFNAFFSELLKDQFYMLGDGITSFIFRMGLATFRIAMVLTMLRRYSEWDKAKPLFDDNEQALLCSDADFRIAMSIMDTLVSHTALIYSTLAKDDDVLFAVQMAQMSAPESNLFKALDDEFSSDDVKRMAPQVNVNYETARRYLNKYVNTYHVAERVKNGMYRKAVKAT